MLSAGGSGTITTWTAMHKSHTDILQNAQWRAATALRLGLLPDVGPRATCALHQSNDGDTCEFFFLLQVWRCQGQTAPGDSVRAAQVDRASWGGEGRREALRTENAVSQSSMTGSGRNAIRRPTIRCAIWDVVSWYAGVLQQLWIDVSVRSPHAERYNESAAKLGAAASAGETEKSEATRHSRSRSFAERDGRLGGEGINLLP